MRSRRLVGVAVVAVVVVVAFVAGIAVFGGGDGDGGCDVGAGRDFAYAVNVESTNIGMGEQTILLSVTRGGRPVADAEVCVQTGMPDGMTTSGEARRVAPGRYEVPLNFEMEGTWEGSVVIEESGRDAASVPVSLTVG